MTLSPATAPASDREAGTDCRGAGTDSTGIEGEILGALAAGPLSGSAIARRLRHRKRVTLAALRVLVAAGQVVREGRGRAARFRRSNAIR